MDETSGQGSQAPAPSALPSPAPQESAPPRASQPPPPPVYSAPLPPPRPAAVPRPGAAPAAARRSNAGWWVVIVLMVLGILGVGAFLSLGSFLRGVLPAGAGMANEKGPHFLEHVVQEGNSHRRILVIPVEGIISSSAIDSVGYSIVHLLEHQLQKAGEDSSVKAVILKVDSPGGEVLASDDMFQLLKKFQEEHKKPVIASMGGMAASGGYYVSAPCRWIVANPLTITGSIGVIMHGFNYRGLMDKVGVRPEVFKSGKFKDMLSGDKLEKDISDEERQMVQNMVNETFGRFKEVVADGRQQANRLNGVQKDAEDQGRKLSDRWADYADGRILTGRQAHELGFVDELGNFDTAVERAATLAGVTDPEVFELHPQVDLSSFLRLFGKAGDGRIRVDLGSAAPVLKPGRMYFIWSMAVPNG